MNTQISSKFAALAAALLINSLLMGGVAYLFTAVTGQQSLAVVSSDFTAAQKSDAAV